MGKHSSAKRNKNDQLAIVTSEELARLDADYHLLRDNAQLKRLAAKWEKPRAAMDSTQKPEDDLTLFEDYFAKILSLQHTLARYKPGDAAYTLELQLVRDYAYKRQEEFAFLKDHFPADSPLLPVINTLEAQMLDICRRIDLAYGPTSAEALATLARHQAKGGSAINPGDDPIPTHKPTISAGTIQAHTATVTTAYAQLQQHVVPLLNHAPQNGPDEYTLFSKKFETAFTLLTEAERNPAKALPMKFTQRIQKMSDNFTAARKELETLQAHKDGTDPATPKATELFDAFSNETKELCDLIRAQRQREARQFTHDRNKNRR